MCLWIRNDIQIARTPNGKKMRIGEGSSGTVYKALMHGCDEVAVKLVKAAVPTEKDRESFHKEVLAHVAPCTKAMPTHRTKSRCHCEAAACREGDCRTFPRIRQPAYIQSSGVRDVLKILGMERHCHHAAPLPS